MDNVPTQIKGRYKWWYSTPISMTARQPPGPSTPNRNRCTSPTKSVDAEEIPERRLFGLIEWLSGSACRDLDEAGLISGLAERLRTLPLPIDCVALYLRTLHPEIRARIIIWSPEAPIEIYDREHTMLHIAAFTGSPVREVMETREWRTVRADADRAVIERLEIFRNRGISQLLIAPLPKSRIVNTLTF